MLHVVVVIVTVTVVVICSFICSFIHPSTDPIYHRASIHPSIHPSMCIHPSIHMFVLTRVLLVFIGAKFCRWSEFSSAYQEFSQRAGYMKYMHRTDSSQQVETYSLKTYIPKFCCCLYTDCLKLTTRRGVSFWGGSSSLKKLNSIFCILLKVILVGQEIYSVLNISDIGTTSLPLCSVF